MKHFFAYIVCAFLDCCSYRRRLPGIPILLYHGIGDESSRLFVSPREFERQMRYLSLRGWRSVLPDALPSLRNGEKAFLITFDDGFSSVYHKALPIVRKYGFTATVFVTTSAIGKDSAYARSNPDRHHRLMDAEELRGLAQKGWCIANHTASHEDLTRLSEEGVSREYRTASATLERIGLSSCRDIVAYPFNCYTEAVMMILSREGVRLAFAGGNRLSIAEHSEHLAIPRLDVTNSFARFKLMFSPSFHRLYVASSRPRFAGR